MTLGEFGYAFCRYDELMLCIRLYIILRSPNPPISSRRTE